MKKTILVTWSSGFIGFHLVKRLLDEGHFVVGIDNENDYYDVTLKQARREELEKSDSFVSYKENLEDLDAVKKIFIEHEIDKIAHMAAQAGVTYWFKDPFCYVQTNIVGFHNLLDEAKNYKVKNFVFASTWSVYGDNEKDPAEPEDRCETPLSIYAATKKSSELIAYVYSYLYDIQTIGLRFFNVIWPRGRPDSAIFLFTKNILAGKPIEVRNHGKMKRNNTYVGDIVDGIVKSLWFKNDQKYQIFNLGNENHVDLMYFIERIEHELGMEAKKEFVDMLPGETAVTSVNSDLTREKMWWDTKVEIEEGICDFVKWYNGFYNV